MANADTALLFNYRRQLPRETAMSNMYGYTDYNGPADRKQPSDANDNEPSEEDHDDDDEVNPLQAGFWMAGDSLAPPCGTAVPTIHALLDFAQVNSKDILYDLGCGDARVCLEAYSNYGCQAVGVEVEVDLVERAQQLISNLPDTADKEKNTLALLPRVIHQDLRDLLDRLLNQLAENNQDGSRSADPAELPLPTIIVLYLLPESLHELQDKFVALLRLAPPPFRILCNTWGFSSLRAIKETEIAEGNGATSPMHLYTRASLVDKEA